MILPKNMSALADAIVFLAIYGITALVMFSYNTYMGVASFVTWACLALFSWERCRGRKRDFEAYCEDVVRNVNEITHHAVEGLPQAILVADPEGRLQWSNGTLEKFVGKKVERGTMISDFWPQMILKPIWGMTGDYKFKAGDASYHADYLPVESSVGMEPFMAFYVTDITKEEALRAEYNASRAVVAYIQVDNYDEVLQDLSEAERSTLLFAVSGMLDAWMKDLGGFLRKLSDEMYVALMERRALDKALGDKFEILDRVRTLKSTNKLPVTLSMGVVATDASQPISELASQAQKKLDLALGRGGDQAAVFVDGKTQFFGGKAQAVEKHTRVKARVVAHALKDLVEGASEVYVMGHRNEDFDALGAAMGIARFTRTLKKPVRIVLSEMNEGIDKFTDLLSDKQEYKGLFTREKELDGVVFPPKSLAIIVDTHIPGMVASPRVLGAIGRSVVIDHHRRSESIVENPLLLYLEPSSSSTSELVTELLMYVSDDIKLTRFDATALYAGIVVDTKHFGVQTGVRTLEAAAYLRRAGADPVLVRQLFREDYETNLTIAKAAASSKLYPGGLIVTSCPDMLPNIQAIAAQAADSLLAIENVRMSIVVFQLTADTVGLSARSVGELNVQVIMEAFGGGGHQNVAGAQVKGEKLGSIMERVVDIAKKYIEENG